MVRWTTWVGVKMEEEGLFAFSPVEDGPDGEPVIVDGMAIITGIDEMKDRAKRLYAIDDIYEPTSPAVLLWEET